MGNLVLIDDRIGSVELGPYVPDSLIVRLEYGDAEWEGNGPEGKIKVGIERKTLGDLVTSVQTGRLVGHQLPGMVRHYDVCYLVIEGLWRRGPGNVIEVWKRGKWRTAQTGRLGWVALHGLLCSLEVMWGLGIRTTTDIGETGELIRGLARWWGKPWEGHKGHHTIYTGSRAKVELAEGEVSVLRKVASVLPGIGYERSAGVEGKFGSVREMCEAGESEWGEIDGIGKVTAGKVWRALRNETGDM